MTAAVLVNGVSPADPPHAIAVDDRGLQYGDGLFETRVARTAAGCDFCEQHLRRLALGCERLGIAAAGRTALLRSDVQRLSGSAERGVLKIVVTRGIGGTRLSAVAAQQDDAHRRALSGAGCSPRRRDSRCAGARRGSDAIPRWPASSISIASNRCWRRRSGTTQTIGEGLMLDTEGELVCGTASNVFMVRDGVLVTPDLRFCGVRGVMRAQVLRDGAGAGYRSQRRAAVAARSWKRRAKSSSRMPCVASARSPRSARCVGPTRPSPTGCGRRWISDATPAANPRCCSSCSAPSARARLPGGATTGCRQPIAGLQRTHDVRSSARRQHCAASRRHLQATRLAGSTAGLDRLGAPHAARQRAEGRRVRAAARAHAARVAGAAELRAGPAAQHHLHRRLHVRRHAQRAGARTTPCVNDIRESQRRRHHACARRARACIRKGSSFPDTYRFPRGTTDLELLRIAHRRMQDELRNGLGEARARPAAGRPVRGADPGLDRREGNRAGTRARADRRRVRRAAAARHAPADRSRP